MFNKLIQYFKDSFTELTKVTFPTKNQAVLLTVVVIGVCFVVAVFLGATDYGLSYGMQQLLQLAL